MGTRGCLCLTGGGVPPPPLPLHSPCALGGSTCPARPRCRTTPPHTVASGTPGSQGPGVGSCCRGGPPSRGICQSRVSPGGSPSPLFSRLLLSTDQRGMGAEVVCPTPREEAVCQCRLAGGRGCEPVTRSSEGSSGSAGMPPPQRSLCSAVHVLCSLTTPLLLWGDSRLLNREL